jgi:hypothetical protein
MQLKVPRGNSNMKLLPNSPNLNQRLTTHTHHTHTTHTPYTPHTHTTHTHTPHTHTHTTYTHTHTPHTPTHTPHTHTHTTHTPHLFHQQLHHLQRSVPAPISLSQNKRHMIPNHNPSQKFKEWNSSSSCIILQEIRNEFSSATAFHKISIHRFTTIQKNHNFTEYTSNEPRNYNSSN